MPPRVTSPCEVDPGSPERVSGGFGGPGRHWQAGAIFGIVVKAAAAVVAVGWLAATGAAIPFGCSALSSSPRRMMLIMGRLFSYSRAPAGPIEKASDGGRHVD